MAARDASGAASLSYKLPVPDLISGIYVYAFKVCVLCHIAAILYNYVIHDGSITSTPYLINQVEDRAFFLKERLDFLRMYYPDLFDIQLSMIIRLLLVCRDRTEGKENYRIINDELTEIVEKYKSRMQDLTGYSKIVWIYYYCPILLKLFMKIRRYLIN